MATRRCGPAAYGAGSKEDGTPKAARSQDTTTIAGWSHPSDHILTYSCVRSHAINSCVRTFEKRTHDTQDTQDTNDTKEAKPDGFRRVPLLDTRKFIEILDSGNRCWWSLAEHVDLSVAHHLAHIEADDEERRSTWRTPLFRFVRAVKAHPELIALDAGEALETVEAELRRINEADPWSVLQVELSERTPEREEVQEEFLLTWHRVRVPHGSQPLQQAARLAADYPLPAEILGPKDKLETYRRVLSLCWWFACIRGGRFFLSCRRVAAMTGIGHDRSNKLLNLAVAEGWLRVARKWPAKARQATEYEFHIERLPAEIQLLADEILGEQNPKGLEDE